MVSLLDLSTFLPNTGNGEISFNWGQKIKQYHDDVTSKTMKRKKPLDVSLLEMKYSKTRALEIFPKMSTKL